MGIFGRGFRLALIILSGASFSKIRGNGVILVVELTRIELSSPGIQMIFLGI